MLAQAVVVVTFAGGSGRPDGADVEIVGVVCGIAPTRGYGWPPILVGPERGGY